MSSVSADVYELGVKIIICIDAPQLLLRIPFNVDRSFDVDQFILGNTFLEGYDVNSYMRWELRRNKKGYLYIREMVDWKIPRIIEYQLFEDDPVVKELIQTLKNKLAVVDDTYPM